VGTEDKGKKIPLTENIGTGKYLVYFDEVAYKCIL
jgi:hypothetical protein